MLGCDTVPPPLVVPQHRGALSVHANGLSHKIRKFVVIRGLGPMHSLGVFNNSILTVQRSFLERYFFCKIEGNYKPPLTVRPRTYVRNSHLSRFKDLLVDACRGAPVVSLQCVVAAYTGPKRRVYQRALESLGRVPLSVVDAWLKSFIKFEKQELLKAPRGISPRSPRYNLVLGKYLKFLEKLIYSAINRAYGSHTRATVIKGYNVIQSAEIIRDKWSLFNNPVAVGLDASKFDMHTTQEALKYEHSVYNGIFKSAELRKLLRWQLVNRGIARCDDGDVRFSIKGTRSSGDLNTSMGNCIIMCALIYAYQKSLQMRVELCNNGDDCVVIMEQADLHRFIVGVPSFFSRHGYRMTVEAPVYEFEQIEFCQSHPVFDGHAWRMVRNVATCVKKDAMCLIPVNSVSTLQKWLWAVGTCGLSITAGMPVMQAFYQCYKRSGIECTKAFIEHLFKNTGVLERQRDVHWEPVAVEAATRVSFYYAFGILPDAQVELERYYDRLSIQHDIEDFDSDAMTVDKPFSEPQILRFFD